MPDMLIASELCSAMNRIFGNFRKSPIIRFPCPISDMTTIKYSFPLTSLISKSASIDPTFSPPPLSRQN